MDFVGVVGSGGFIGSAVAARLEARGIAHRSISRISGIDAQPGDPLKIATKSFQTNSSAFGEILEQFSRLTAIVNCAGAATPTSRDHTNMWQTNTLLPCLLSVLCQASSNQPRLIHVSSAAVQGNSRTLDETPHTNPLSLYASTKASAERALLEAHSYKKTTIYRATSVMGAERSISQQLARLYSGPISPIVGSGKAQLPLASLENTADALVFLATHPTSKQIALHPWEGATQLSVANALRSERAIRVRLPLPSGAERVSRRVTSLPAPLGPILRRVDLQVFGQQQIASTLPDLGFVAKGDLHQTLREIGGR